MPEQIPDVAADLVHTAPELVLVAGMVVLLLSGLLKREAVKLCYTIAMATLIADLVVTLSFTYAEPFTFFGGFLRASNFVTSIRLLVAVAGICTLLLQGMRQTKKIAEFHLLILAMVLGGQWLALSNHFLMLLLSFELLSLSSYVLVNFLFDRRSAEGSLKYFLFGSAATALMIYGASLLYGITGTLDFTSTAIASTVAHADRNLVLLAGLALLAGLLFKIAAAPFHFWAPDVYESTSYPVLALFSTVPKIAGMAALVKVVVALHAFGLSPVAWTSLVAGIAILTLTAGNFAALWQWNVRRLLAWSSIAQSGFMLVAVASLGPTTSRFLIFYMAVFVASNFLTVLGLQQLEDLTSSGDLRKYAGLGARAAWISGTLTIGLISLTGLPPTAGFTGKLLLFSGLWETWQAGHDGWMLFLLVFGLLNTVVALFYYFKLPYYLFLKPAGSPLSLNGSKLRPNLFALVLVVVILLLFFQPGLLMGWLNTLNFDL